MALVQLSYVSRPRPGTTVEHLDGLVGQAAAHNRKQCITGLLGFRPDLFCQVLEGEHAEVSSLFLRIAGDPRHHDVLLVGLERIDRRRFPSWSMGYVSFDALARGQMLEFAPSDEPDFFALEHAALVEILGAATRVVSVEPGAIAPVPAPSPAALTVSR